MNQCEQINTSTQKLSKGKVDNAWLATVSPLMHPPKSALEWSYEEIIPFPTLHCFLVALNCYKQLFGICTPSLQSCLKMVETIWYTPILNNPTNPAIGNHVLRQNTIPQVTHRKQKQNQDFSFYVSLYLQHCILIATSQSGDGTTGPQPQPTKSKVLLFN